MDSAERRAVRQSLDALKPYLEAFLAQHGVTVESTSRGHATVGPDIQALLKACVANWDLKLGRVLPRVARSYVHELLDVRNRWAHEEPFSEAASARAIDTARMLGSLIGAPMSTAAPAPTFESSRPASRKRRESQRDAMIRMFVAAGRDPEKAVREYAAAERRGEVVRKSNKYAIDSEVYARALLNDGLKKGWLV